MICRFGSYERRHQPLVPFHEFLGRLVNHGTMAFALIAASLAIGMAGYHLFEGMELVDSYLDASMILAGMGPVATLQTTAGKVFAATYALFCGVVLIFATGIILAPVVHRVLHSFHIDDHDGKPTRHDTKG